MTELYNKDYDPKTDDKPAPERPDYQELICPITLASDKAKLCAKNLCVLWSYKRNVCMLENMVSQLGVMSVAMREAANRYSWRMKKQYWDDKNFSKKPEEDGL